MDELYQKLAFGKSFDLWGHSTNSNEKSFEVLEGWLDHATGKVRHKTRVIDDKNMASWLAEEFTGPEEKAQYLVLRLVWVNVDVADKKILLDDSVQQTLIEAFGLKLAHGYAKSCLNNVSAISPSKEQGDLRSFAFCYVPKIASVWSHGRFDSQSPMDRPLVTRGLIFVQNKEKQVLSKFLSSPWDTHIYSTAMLLPFLFSLLLLAGVHETDGTIKKIVRNMELRTGHHIFNSIGHDKTEDATAKLVQLSAKANGCAAKLASAGRKSKMVESLLTFITANLDKDDHARRDKNLEPTDGSRFLREHVRVLQERLAMLHVDTDYTLKRVQVQISALASTIAHTESLAQIQVAHLSYRDSLSMKTLAVVTMFFLPGSFVSALFSTQLFNWDSVKPGSKSIGLQTTPQFTLYWVITVVLTLVVFLLYFGWSWLETRRWDRMHPTSETTTPDNSSSSSLEKGEKANGALTFSSLSSTF